MALDIGTDCEKSDTKEKEMKKRLSGILFGLVFLTGLGIFLYPTISEQWNKYHQSKAIAGYEELVADMAEEDFDTVWAEAGSYNAAITMNTFGGDAFSKQENSQKDTAYWAVLNLENNGIMGYISIPKINQKLPIYHGTSDPVLQIGVGHISGTKLPVGGKGTHSVLAAHRGLPSARLFTDIDQLKAGDKFYIHVLNEVLAYEVDRILPMVDKNDMESLTEALQNEEGQDYVTLFTCTPYGVNSHRLLVRGHRTEYHGEDDENLTVEEAMLQSVKDYYMFYALLAVASSILIAICIRMFRNRILLKKRREDKKWER